MKVYLKNSDGSTVPFVFPDDVVLSTTMPLKHNQITTEGELSILLYGDTCYKAGQRHAIFNDPRITPMTRWQKIKWALTS